MDPSYMASNGPAKRSWETKSGGVRIAAATKITKTAYLRLRERIEDETTPMRAKKRINAGHWNNRPKARRSLMVKVR